MKWEPLKWQSLDETGRKSAQNEKFQITVSRTSRPRGEKSKVYGIRTAYYSVALYRRGSGGAIRGGVVAKSYVSGFISRLKRNAETVADGFKFYEGQVVAPNRGDYALDYGFVTAMQKYESGDRVYTVHMTLKKPVIKETRWGPQRDWNIDIQVPESELHETTIRGRF